MNLPNKITLLRIGMIVPLLVVLIFPFLPEVAARITAFVLFAVAAYTDRLDGMLARKLGLVTDLGKFLDPVADKLLIAASLTGILVFNADYGGASTVLLDRMIALSLFIILLREFAVTSARTVIAGKKSVIMPADLFGKIKTVSQIVCVLILLAEPFFAGFLPFLRFYPLSYLSLFVSTFATVFSGINYLRVYLPLLKNK